jgi:hypothetical protein
LGRPHSAVRRKIRSAAVSERGAGSAWQLKALEAVFVPGIAQGA